MVNAGVEGAPHEAHDPLLDAAFHRSLVENLADGVYFVDRTRRIRYWNQGAEHISGYPASEVVERFCFDDILAHVDDGGNLLCHSGCHLVATMDLGTPQECTLWLRHAKGHRVPVRVRTAPIHDHSGAVIGAVEVFDDATLIVDARERAEAASRAALTDPLTGLANRRQLDLVLEARMAGLVRYGWGFGVLVLDIDHFKAVNDAYGHAVGDAVLRTVADTLGGGVRVDDFAGRWGGEEFLVIASSVDAQSLAELAERIRALVAASAARTTEGPVGVTVSVGATLARPTDAKVELLTRADGAMYEAKRAGRDGVFVV